MSAQPSRTVRTLAWLLRFAPGLGKIRMNQAGYVTVDDLLSYLRITRVGLDKLVDQSEGRYMYDSSHRFVRATGGHSPATSKLIDEHQLLTPIKPTELYIRVHNLSDIGPFLNRGMYLPKNRAYFLTVADWIESSHSTASTVSRAWHFLRLDTEAMRKAGVAFFDSKRYVSTKGDNGWLRPEWLHRVQPFNQPYLNEVTEALVDVLGYETTDYMVGFIGPELYDSIY